MRLDETIDLKAEVSFFKMSFSRCLFQGVFFYFFAKKHRFLIPWPRRAKLQQFLHLSKAFFFLVFFSFLASSSWPRIILSAADSLRSSSPIPPSLPPAFPPSL